jgi:hypothetical protein
MTLDTSPDDAFEPFMKRVLQSDLPGNPMARVRTLAKELAEGAVRELWPVDGITDYREGESHLPDELKARLDKYFQARWNYQYPRLELLARNGYLTQDPRDDAFFVVAKTAFDLVEEVAPATSFISYRRKDSSAFALLILARLKAAGLQAYLDLAIPAGDDWQQRIKDEIDRRDYFILLLGQETLSSSVVQQEIVWALQGGKTIIPIWHNGSQYPSGRYTVLIEVDEVLRKKNAIRVLEESGLGYETAIIELLNRFGITP